MEVETQSSRPELSHFAFMIPCAMGLLHLLAVQMKTVLIKVPFLQRIVHRNCNEE
jgi:hypothetical protein